VDRADAAKGAVVLIVEDEALVRMSAADILQEAGFHVVESRDGMEALARGRQAPPDRPPSAGGSALRTLSRFPSLGYRLRAEVRPWDIP